MKRECERMLGDPCPHCGGTGRQVATHERHRVFHRYQDSGWTEPKEFASLRAARGYVRRAKDAPGGQSTMFLIVAPDGTVKGEG